MFAAAFYKGTDPFPIGILDYLIKAFENGPYCHCEMVFSDGCSASATIEDHGVRFTGPGQLLPALNFMDTTQWDLIPLPAPLEAPARLWYQQHDRWAYDIRGDLRFLWPWGNRDSKDKTSCFKSLLQALNIEPDQAFRLGVNNTATLLRAWTQTYDLVPVSTP